MDYDSYIRLTNQESHRDNYTNYQWKIILKLAAGKKPLTAQELRAMRMSDILDKDNDLTLVGRVVTSNINKKKKKKSTGPYKGKGGKKVLWLQQTEHPPSEKAATSTSLPLKETTPVIRPSSEMPKRQE